MNFDELKKKAQELVDRHGDSIEQAAERAGEFAKRRLGHPEQVDNAVRKAKSLIDSARSGPTGQQGQQ